MNQSVSWPINMERLTWRLFISLLATAEITRAHLFKGKHSVQRGQNLLLPFFTNAAHSNYFDTLARFFSCILDTS